MARYHSKCLLRASLRETVDRYELFGELGSGGMGRVVVGRLGAPLGFARIVAVKRPHAGFSRDAEVRRAIAREAKIAARVHHANVVSTLDVVEAGAELLVVMEYVRGETLANLLRCARRRGERVPIDIAAACVVDALAGLGAVHAARDESGRPLCLVHRDVSPQNILCGADGVVRLSDFGLARSAERVASTEQGKFVGKLAYAAPEQLASAPLNFGCDLYSMGLVLWELLTGERPYAAGSAAQVVARLLNEPLQAPSRLVTDVPSPLDAIVARALEPMPERRFGSATEMAEAIQRCVQRASASAVADWVRRLGAPTLALRDALVADAERAPRAARRSSLAWSARAMAAVCGIVGVVSVSWRARWFEPAPQASVAVVSQLHAARVNVEASEPSVEQRAPERDRIVSVTTPARGRAPVAHLAESTNCTPPFSVDPSGIRRMKAGCR